MSNISKLTRFPVGSIRELGSIALPLMLNNLSNNLMLFLDRLILARSSTEEMNAAVTIGMACSILLFAVSAIASTAEIFVGRNNGSGLSTHIGSPVWQMVWFSLATFILFIPVGLFAENLFIPAQYQNIGLPFFQWYMFCGPIFPLVMALTSFYIGRGKIKLVTITIIIGNVVNFILAFILVLGIKNLIPAMGMKGAAIATIIAQFSQAVILFAFFLAKNNRDWYGTSHFKINIKLFIECLQVGTPIAIGYVIEIGAWALLLRTLTGTGDAYITIFAIGQSLFVLFTFISEGMQKSITILASNFIGANKWNFIPDIFRSAMKLQLLFAFILAIPLIFCSDIIIHSFTSQSSLDDLSAIHKLSKYALLFFWLFFIFDGIKWIVASILIALKQTLPVMLVNFASVWFFMVVPIAILVGVYRYPPLTVWMVVVIYSVLNMMILLVQWKKSHNLQYINAG